MKIHLILFILLLIANSGAAQQDYFYAQDLVYDGKHAEAVKVLDHLIDSGAYADRPRFAMMTLNLAGSEKLYLQDTAGAKKCFGSAMACYDTLSGPRKSDDWNRREYYRAGERLAWICYSQQEYTKANDLLIRVGYPGDYYSATGIDVLLAQDEYCRLRTRIFEKQDQPDSAFFFIRKMSVTENPAVRVFDSIFDIKTNVIHHVKCIPYSMVNMDVKNKIPGYLYFVAWNDHENTQHSIWFVNPQYTSIRVLGQSTYNLHDDQNFPANCYEMSLSPDEKYLAVECYTEGSNFIDIFSFPELLNERRCVLRQTVLAYPASVEIKGWENSMLIVESDADLTRLNKKIQPNWDVSENPDIKELFLFDPDAGKYTKK